MVLWEKQNYTINLCCESITEIFSARAKVLLQQFGLEISKVWVDVVGERTQV